MALARFRQGLLALVAWARPVNVDAATAALSPRLMELFRRMPRRDQQHALEVLATLRASGASHPALLTAGLLHDVGKIRYPLYLWDRVLVVLVEAAFPNLAARLGAAPPRGWQRPFVIRHQHPAWSADLVAEYGGDALTVTLVRRHADRLPQPPTDEADRLLAALQAADDAN
jgi:hypothetical protein